MSESERFQRLYAMLLDAMPSSVLLFDRELRVLAANRNFLDKSRRTEADTLGHHVEQVFPSAILASTDLVQHLRQAIAESKESPSRHFTYRTPGLPRRCYYYKVLPLTGGEAVEAVMLLLDDVSEQVRLTEEIRRVERHLACVVDCASDMVLSTDRNGRLLTWNRAAEHLSGYSAAEVLERPLAEFCVPEHRDEAQLALRRTIETRTTCSGAWHVLARDGRRIPVTWLCSPLDNDAGLVAVGRDLTEQRKLELQLLQAQKYAALGVMAGGLAHELRNPLTICSSYTQSLLQGDDGPEDRRQCLGYMLAAVRRATVIIEDLMRYSRTPPGDHTFEPVDLVRVLGDTLALFAHEAKFQSVRLAVALPEHPVFVQGSASMLQQVCMNLCLYALEAMSDGGVLSVELTAGNLQALLVVRDTGAGIAETELASIFDPFHPLSAHRDSGLGLSLCYSIVKQHLGSITVDSASGAGTTFTIRLPMV